MYIKTERGWVMLQPKLVTPAAPDVAHNGVPAIHDEVLPSKRCCEYINSLKEKMKYFDDGLRLMHDANPKHVQTELQEPIHPIKSPPPGFEIVPDVHSSTGFRVRYLGKWGGRV